MICEYPPSNAGVTANGRSTRSHGSDVETTVKSQEASPRFIDSPYTDSTDGEDMQETSERRMTELFLLHHFIRITPTLPPSFDPSLLDATVNEVPRIACQHPCLMSVMLAFAALHIVYDKETRESPLTPQLDWGTVHRTYLNLGIRQQRETLSELTPFNAEATCWASIFIMYQIFKLLPRSQESLELDPNQPYSPPLDWFYLSTPIQAVIAHARKILPPEATILRLLRSNKPKLWDVEALLAPFQRAMPKFEDFLDYDTYPEYAADQQHVLLLDQDTQDAYEKTLSYLGSIYGAIFHDREPPLCVARRILGYAVIVPRRYCSLLQERRPRALAMFALFAALMKYVDGLWLFNGRADAELNGIEKILGPSWQVPMKWVREVMLLAASKSHDFPQRGR